MNCEEVANHFSDYLDKSLDTATMTRVATHIIACPLCRAESNDLAECIEQVASLPPLDAPIGFAQRIMAHVREVEEKPTIWQWLFQSLGQRVPLQASAVVMVAVLAVFLYQKEEPLKQNNSMYVASQSAPPAATAEKPQALTRESSTPSPVRPPNEKKFPATVQAPTAVAKPLTDAAARERLADLSAPHQQPQAPAPLRAEVESQLEERKEAPRRPPIRALEVTTGREAGPMSGGAFGFGVGLPFGDLRQLTPRSAPIALENSLPLGGRTADFEFVVRRRPAQRRDQAESASVDSTRPSAEADATGFASRRPTAPAAAPKIESFAEIRLYNVAPEHFEIFKKELAAEANIESESKIYAKENNSLPNDRHLLIKVTILQPDSTASSR